MSPQEWACWYTSVEGSTYHTQVGFQNTQPNKLLSEISPDWGHSWTIACYPRWEASWSVPAPSGERSMGPTSCPSHHPLVLQETNSILNFSIYALTKIDYIFILFFEFLLKYWNSSKFVYLSIIIYIIIFSCILLMLFSNLIGFGCICYLNKYFPLRDSCQALQSLAEVDWCENQW